VPQAEIRSNDSAAVPANPAPPAAVESTAVEPTATKPKLSQAARKLEAKAPAANEPAATKSELTQGAPKLEADAPAAIAAAPAPARSESLPEAPAAAAAELERSATLVGLAAPAQDSVAPAAALAVPPTPALSARRADAPALPRQRTELSVAGAQALIQKGPSAAAGSLADVRRAIAAQPERWTWRLGADTPRAMTNELQAWLARLDAAAGVALNSAAPQTPNAAVNATQTLHLIRDSQLHSSLNWDDGTLQMIGTGGTQVSRRAGLAPQTARELDAALAQIAAR
jgi:ribonuclease E